MAKVSIHEFRSRLAGGRAADSLLAACRELARRPDAARRARMAAWGDWAGPPGGRR